ncbi:MAG TPA: hypothetical protein DDY13_06085 [Cytophagales bacterium]|jgi:hypothetical protein|nr:hypothetical protein [Cytophagales bacterium]
MAGNEEYGEAGFGYHARYGAIAYLIIININETLSFGYSYDFPIARIDHRFLGNSHELMLANDSAEKSIKCIRGINSVRKENTNMFQAEGRNRQSRPIRVDRLSNLKPKIIHTGRMSMKKISLWTSKQSLAF